MWSGKWRVAGAALRMTWQTHGLEKSQDALGRGLELCTQLLILNDVSQNGFVFDVVNFEN